MSAVRVYMKLAATVLAIYAGITFWNTVDPVAFKEFIDTTLYPAAAGWAGLAALCVFWISDLLPGKK